MARAWVVLFLLVAGCGQLQRKIDQARAEAEERRFDQANRWRRPPVFDARVEAEAVEAPPAD